MTIFHSENKYNILNKIPLDNEQKYIYIYIYIYFTFTWKPADFGIKMSLSRVQDSIQCSKYFKLCLLYSCVDRLVQYVLALPLELQSLPTHWGWHPSALTAASRSYQNVIIISNSSHIINCKGKKYLSMVFKKVLMWTACAPSFTVLFN